MHRVESFCKLEEREEQMHTLHREARSLFNGAVAAGKAYARMHNCIRIYLLHCLRGTHIAPRSSCSHTWTTSVMRCRWMSPSQWRYHREAARAPERSARRLCILYVLLGLVVSRAHVKETQQIRQTSMKLNWIDGFAKILNAAELPSLCTWARHSTKPRV